MSAAADYVIADIALADWGRKEIRIAETEMPGLMAIRKEYAGQKPLATGSCRRSHCRRGHSRFRRQGRIYLRLLELHAPHF